MERDRAQAYVATRGFNVLFIDRCRTPRSRSTRPLGQALETRANRLIHFSLRVRARRRLPSAFKSDFLPCGKIPARRNDSRILDNLYRSMPKGTTWPVPADCSVPVSAAPLQRVADKQKMPLEPHARRGGFA